MKVLLRRALTTEGGAAPTPANPCGMKGVHGVHEQIAVADLVGLTNICVAVAERMAEER